VAEPEAIESPEPEANGAPDCERPGDHACVGDELVECLAAGTRGKTLQTCKDGCKRGVCVDPCAARDVELVYVVNADSELLSFDPRKLPGDPFRLVGKLTCDPSSGPFSMAVDRMGVAWVVYGNGTLHRVSILDAHCAPTAYMRGLDVPETFGMGFVTDGPKSTTEKLFVSANDDSQMLARLDTSQEPARWEPIGRITAKQVRNPELTGTGEGKLFGYFPEDGRGFVQELDRTTGRAIGPRTKLGATTGTVRGWAFAHWGGVFYVFATVDENSAVHAVNRKTGKSELVREHLPFRIVGAGVSTCAPLLERTP
jgi:hypothetical protein